MNYSTLTINELSKKIKNKEISILELTKNVIENSKKYLDSNFFVTLNESNALEIAKKLDNEKPHGKLFGIPFFQKDNIATKNLKTTSSSNILKNFIPPYSATVHELLTKENSILIGKTALDELGMGGTGLYSSTGIVYNPRDKKRIIGGSSSGSAFAVAAGITPFATGTDTGDSIRKPASLNGIVGFKPTYGAISRFGLFPYAPSLDTIGFIAKTVEDIALLSDISFVKDLKDFTSTEIENKKFLVSINKDQPKTKFAFIKEVYEKIPEWLKKEYTDFFESLKKDGHKFKMISFNKELLESLTSIYQIISFAEAVSTNSNLDGIKFGQRVDGDNYIDIMKKSRSAGFGSIVKRRFTVGSFQLREENQEELFLKSKKIRRMIINEFENIYKEIDILILPPSISKAKLINEALNSEIDERTVDDEYIDDILILANMNGMPSITLPFTKEDGMPVGINLNAAPKEDAKLLQAASYVEKKLNIPVEIAVTK